MTFKELTEEQSSFLLNVIDNIQTGDYTNTFLVYGTLGREWKTTLQSVAPGKNIDLPGISEPNLIAIKDAGYIALTSNNKLFMPQFNVVLKQKAFDEYARPNSARTESFKPIFLNYRQSDSQDITDRIYDHLSDHFGKENVFIDTESLSGGDKFRKKALLAAENCKVFLPVIGSNWLDSVYHKGKKKGQRRLADPDDLVRNEIATAIRKYKKKGEMKVMPLRVRNANMPEEIDLPKDIRDLVGFNWRQIRPGGDFKNDIKLLIEEINRYQLSKDKNDTSTSLPALPDMELLLFTPEDEQPRTEIKIHETSNSSHPFGIVLTNSSSTNTVGILINVDIYWTGNDSKVVREFYAPRGNSGWEANIQTMKQHQWAILAYKNSEELVAQGHDLRWKDFRFSIEKPGVLKGSFELHYKITSLTPPHVQESVVKITLN